MTYDLDSPEPDGPHPHRLPADDKPALFPDRDRFCLNCKYNLRGVPEPVCPECGQTFDPHRPATSLEHAGAKLPSHASLPIARVCVLLAALLAGWGLYLSSFSLSPLWCVMIVLFPFWAALVTYLALGLLPEGITERLMISAPLGFAVGGLVGLPIGWLACAVVALLGPLAALLLAHRRLTG